MTTTIGRPETAEGESILKTEFGKTYLKYVVGLYAICGAGLGAIVVAIAAIGTPVMGADGDPFRAEMAVSLTATWAMIGAPFLATILGVLIGRSLAQSLDAPDGEVRKLAGVASAAGTVALVAIAGFLASTELGAASGWGDLTLAWGTLATGAAAAGIVVGLISAATVYAERELRPAH